MKATLDKTENCQAYLTIEMEPPEVEEGLKKAYGRLVQKYVVPGFRKGKAPRPILEQYLGKSAFLEDAVEHMAPDAIEKALKEKELKVIARPEVQLEKTEPVTYKVIAALEPVITLGDYKNIRMAQESIELKEEDVNNSIERLRHQHSIWEPVDRQVNSRDMVNLDIESKVGDQPYINQKDAEYEVQKESEFPVKGFSEELIGMKKGETKEFKLSFPQDYGRTELAGKEANFKVNVKEIKQEKLPEVNDDFAKQVNSDFKTVDDLKNKLSEELKKAAEEASRKNYEQKIVDEVVKISNIEYPQVMEEEEIDNMMRQQMQRWQMDEKGMDQYLQSIQKTAQQLREEMRPAAIRSLKQSLVLTKVAETENVRIEKEDLQKEIEDMVKDVPEERKPKLIEILNNPQTQVSIAASVATKRTIEKLTDIAKSSAPVAESPKTEEKVEEQAEEKAEEPKETKAAKKESAKAEKAEKSEKAETKEKSESPKAKKKAKTTE